MPPSSKISLRNTPLPFMPKSHFKKKLESALKLAKDMIERGDSSDSIHLEALRMRRASVFALGKNRDGLKQSSVLWGKAHLLDIVGMIWDESFLNSISDEDTPTQLKERARQCMINAGYLSTIEPPEPKEGGAAFWKDPALRQFSRASQFVAQSEILQEFAKIREENSCWKPAVEQK